MKRGLLGLVLIPLLVSCAGGDGDSSAKTAKITETVTVTAEPDAAQPEDSATDDQVEDAGADIGPKDFVLRVKITDKQCFGSAGCSIDYEVVPTFKGDVTLLDEVSLDLTYKVTGDESGPIIGTLSFDAGQYTVNEESASTSTTSVQLKAIPTEVSLY